MTSTLLFKTEYQNGPAPWGVPPQAPDGMITRGKETDGRWYQRHECNPTKNWVDGMQRADVLEAKTTVLNLGDELAFSFSQLLERGFYAPNPGWCVTGIEIHDAKGSTQSWLEMLTSQNGIQFRVFGGVMGSNGAPVDNT